MADDRPITPRRPQLFMMLPTFEQLPPPPAVAPYRIRTYQPGDEEAWARIMNTGIGEGWTAARCREFLIERPEFHPNGLFFAVVDGGAGEEVAGTTCAWKRSPDETETGIVHMVCVHPAHRGHHLGAALVVATLQYFRDHGFQRSWLSTDDFRLSAIRTYLDLGFVPELTDPSHPERWATVMRELAARQQPSSESAVEAPRAEPA